MVSTLIRRWGRSRRSGLKATQRQRQQRRYYFFHHN
jgi:hypothetical protein